MKVPFNRTVNRWWAIVLPAAAFTIAAPNLSETKVDLNEVNRKESEKMMKTLSESGIRIASSQLTNRAKNLLPKDYDLPDFKNFNGEEYINKKFEELAEKLLSGIEKNPANIKRVHEALGPEQKIILDVIKSTSKLSNKILENISSFAKLLESGSAT